MLPLQYKPFGPDYPFVGIADEVGDPVLIGTFAPYGDLYAYSFVPPHMGWFYPSDTGPVSSNIPLGWLQIEGELILPASDAISDVCLDLETQPTLPCRVVWIESEDNRVKHFAVRDATNAVVFDSRDYDDAERQEYDWGDFYYAVQWAPDDGRLCRLVCRTAIALSAPGPFEGELDPVTISIRPARVTAVTADGQTSQERVIQLPAGVNAGWSQGDSQDNPGGPNRHAAILTLAGGSGLGFPAGCDDRSFDIRYLGETIADSHGSVRLSMTGCYAGYVPALVSGVTATPDPSTIKLRNDCGPCYPCSAFEAVYTAMKRLNEQLHGLGGRLDAVNREYSQNRTRWLNQKACRESHPVRVILLSSPPETGEGQQVQASITLGNTHGACIGRAGVELSWETSGGVPIPTVISNRSRRYVSAAGRPQPYALGGTWPTYTADWDYIPSGNYVIVTATWTFPPTYPGAWVRLTAIPNINGVSEPDGAHSDTVTLGINS